MKYRFQRDAKYSLWLTYYKSGKLSDSYLYQQEMIRINGLIFMKLFALFSRNPGTNSKHQCSKVISFTVPWSKNIHASLSN